MLCVLWGRPDRRPRSWNVGSHRMAKNEFGVFEINLPNLVPPAPLPPSPPPPPNPLLLGYPARTFDLRPHGSRRLLCG